MAIGSPSTGIHRNSGFLHTVLLLFSLGLAAQTGSDPIVQITYRNTPLRTVLHDLSSRTGLQFVFYDQLVDDKVVTCRFKSRSLTRILNRILLTQGLLYERSSGHIVTLYQRIVPPRTWVFQGQVLSGDSAYVADAELRLDPGAHKQVTDSQGCFVYMDLSRSPCILTIEHPDFESVQMQFDSSQAFYPIRLILKPIQEIEGCLPAGSIRQAPPVPEWNPRKFPETQSRTPQPKRWKDPDSLIWIADYQEGGHALLRFTETGDPALTRLAYAEIPVFRLADDPFGRTGFHEANASRVSVMTPDGTTLDFSPPSIHGSGLRLFLNPVMLRAHAAWQPGASLQVTTAGSISPFSANAYPALDEFHQMSRYHAVRPVAGPVLRHQDLAVLINWTPSPGDSMSAVVIHDRDVMDTSIETSDSLISREVLTGRQHQLGMKIEWRHRWHASAETRIRSVYSGFSQTDAYAFASQGISEYQDKSLIGTTGFYLEHHIRFSERFETRLHSGFERIQRDQTLRSDEDVSAENVLDAIECALTQLYKPSLLMEWEAGVIVSGRSAGIGWTVDPAAGLRYRVRENLHARISYRRRTQALHAVPNQIRTKIPWRNPVLWVPADSRNKPSRSDDVTAGLRHEIPGRSLELSAFFNRSRDLLNMIPLAADEEGPADFELLYQQGRSAHYGLLFNARISTSRFDSRLIYRRSVSRSRFPSFYENREYTPAWHRDHAIECMVQTEPMGMHFRCSAAAASGAMFSSREQVYQMTQYGPDTREVMTAMPSARSPFYFRIDLTAEKTFDLRSLVRMAVSLSVSNLLNRKNSIAGFYFLEPARPAESLPAVCQPLCDLPRTVWVKAAFQIWNTRSGKEMK